MYNILFLYFTVQFLFGTSVAHDETESKPQQYQSFFNGPQSFYQQHHMTHVDSQRWYYSSNQKPVPYGWYWTNRDAPSSNFYKNNAPYSHNDLLSNVMCGRNQLTNVFGRIMGGQDALPHLYPWMVSLTKRALDNIHICGGVLITKRHVLTAAHCMEDFDGANDLNIIAGSHHSTDKRNPVPVMTINVHPQYNPETFANDIAVVTLRYTLPDNDPRIGIICLPPDDVPNKAYPAAKTKALAIGWGSTYFGGSPSKTLKQVTLPILQADKWPCNIYITHLSGQICAGLLQGGADTCQADSGGPLMIENADNRWEIVGITSFGKSCGNPNTPGIYTRVGTYNSFIRSIVGLSTRNLYYMSSTRWLYSSNGFISIPMLLIVFLFNPITT